MSRRRPVPFTTEEIIARFEAGEGRLDLTKRYRVRVAEIDAALATAGYEAPKRQYVGHSPARLQLPEQEIVDRYLAGESELALSKVYGCARAPIRRVLNENGVAARGRGAAMKQRHAVLSVDERQALAEAAHTAARGRVVSEATLATRASSVGGEVNRWTSPYEMQLDTMLRERGIVGQPQLPVGRYNIDLAVESLAVELHRQEAHPMKYRGQPARVAYLAERGWSTLYVWLRTRQPLTDAVVDLVAAQVREYRQEPSAFGDVRTVGVLRSGPLLR